MESLLRTLESKYPRRIGNCALIQFLKDEYKDEFPPTLEGETKDGLSAYYRNSVYSVVLGRFDTIILYTQILKLEGHRAFGELITTITLDKETGIDDIVRFCTTNDNRRFYLVNKNIFVPGGEWRFAYTRHGLTRTCIRCCNHFIELKPDDQIIDVSIPGKPIYGVYLMVQRIKDGEITRWIVESVPGITARLIEIDSPSETVSKNYFHDIFNLFKRNLSSKSYKRYDKLD